jgi:hypothetical protein
MQGLKVTNEGTRMGELEPWMDENFIKGVFLSSAGETVNVKVIRDKNSG